MRITARLALSQIKKNKKRTMGSIVAIAFSTALLTTLSCMASSGIAMLKSFLGDDFGDYGAAYSSFLAIPAVILGLLVCYMSVNVISNVFQSSTNERLKQFGILKCVGGTGRTIRETVIYESIFLSSIAIPIGLLLGLLLGYTSVTVTDGFVDKFNELSKTIILTNWEFDLKFHVSFVALVVAAVCSVITVYVSASKPAKKAGKITALECLNGFVQAPNPKKIKKGSSLYCLFGDEWEIASKNILRNKSAYSSIIKSLSLGITLLLTISGLILQVSQINNLMRGRDIMMVEYASIADRSEDGASRDYRYAEHPIDYDTAQTITDELSMYDGGLEVFGCGSDGGKYYAVIDKADVSEDMFPFLQEVNDSQVEAKVEVYTVDKKNYEKLCNEAGVSVGSTILMNLYNYNKKGVMKDVVPYEESISHVVLEDVNGNKTDVSIDGMLYRNQIPNDMIAIYPAEMCIILPESECRYYTWFADPINQIDFTDYARNVTDRFFYTESEDPYYEEGFVVRISKEDTMIQMLNIAIVLAEVIAYGFLIMLLVIGLTSVINTISTNILMRAREFAVLKSIGMTSKSLKKMLICESVICVSKAMIRGIPIGLFIPFVINLSIRNGFPVVFQVPWSMLVLSGGLIFGLVVFVTVIVTRKLKNQNIIDTIRLEAV